MSDPNPDLFAMPPEPNLYLFRKDEKPGFLSNGSYLLRESSSGLSGGFVQTTNLSAAKLIAMELQQEDEDASITILRCTEHGVDELQVEKPA